MKAHACVVCSATFTTLGGRQHHERSHHSGMGVSILAALSTTPITKKALAEKLATSSREVELMIHAARLEGAPICSDDRGYWLGTAAEVAECARRLRSRYINQALTARALRRAAARMERQLEQETLWAA